MTKAELAEAACKAYEEFFTTVDNDTAYVAWQDYQRQWAGRPKRDPTDDGLLPAPQQDLAAVMTIDDAIAALEVAAELHGGDTKFGIFMEKFFMPVEEKAALLGEVFLDMPKLEELRSQKVVGFWPAQDVSWSMLYRGIDIDSPTPSESEAEKP
jgi:hypothetical protein